MISCLSDILKVLIGVVTLVIGSCCYLGFLFVLSPIRKEYKNSRIYTNLSKPVYIFYNIVIIICILSSVVLQFTGLYLIY